MNIFVLDTDPIIAARYQCDKHVVKMVLESAQLLSTAHRVLDGKVEKRPSRSGLRMIPYFVMDDDRETKVLKASQIHHPCAKWVRESGRNYMWLHMHLTSLCYEYTYRYGRIHKIESDNLNTLFRLPRNIPILKEMTPFALAMKHRPDCMALGDPVKAYRAYYCTKKEQFRMVWTKRSIPEWF